MAPVSLNMAAKATTVGTCPECGTTIKPSQVLIEYEKNGEQAVYADCYACDEVVHPA